MQKAEVSTIISVDATIHATSNVRPLNSNTLALALDLEKPQVVQSRT
jgi:hypothetical protein